MRAMRDASLGGAAAWFPLVGAGVGALAGGVRAGAEPLVGAGPATVLALAALVVATGALHQDGLADCADGLGARGDRERRLEIMRDSSIGTFGALALGLWLLLFVSVLAFFDRTDALRTLVAAAATARAAALLHATLARPARPDGLGAGFTVHPAALAFALLTAIAIALAVARPARGAAALAAALAVALLVTTWSRRTLGGRTGDALGATVALAEIAAAAAILATT
jgi:adenosylcobinamide-GDP ribazoletransferase